MKRKRITDFFKNKKYTIITSVCVALLIMCNVIFSALPSNFEAAEYITETMSLLQDGAIVPVSDDFVSLDKQTQGVKTAGVTSAKSTQTAEQVIYNGLLNVSSSIDVSRFKLTSDELTEILQNIINSSPELFYMESRWGWIGESDGSRVDTVKPYYNDTADNIAFKKIEYENEMNKILAGIDSDWSDLEKVVYVHDYLVQNYEYDTSYTIYDAYNFLAKGKGVCQSYTLVFCGIMQELGIDVSYASSEGMNHIWNVVKVNGNWYHVDNTWDDPVTDRLGLAAHENMLLSDAAIQQTSSPHYGWETSYTCTSTAYDNYYWKAIQSPFKYASGSWYYVSYDSADSGANLYKCSIDGQNEKVLSIGRWVVANTTSYYIEAFSGLYISGNNLFYNDLGKIYVYDLSSKTTQTLYEPNTNKRIWGFNVKNNMIYYLLANDANGTSGEILTYNIPSQYLPATTAPATTAPTTTAPTTTAPATTVPTTTVPTTTVPTTTAPGRTTAPTTTVPATTAPGRTTAPTTTTPGTTTAPGRTTAPATTVPATTTPGRTTVPATTTPGRTIFPTITTPVRTTAPATTVPATTAPGTTTAPTTTTPGTTTAPGRTTAPTTTAPGTITTPDSNGTRLLGDANKDNKVDLKDAKIVLAYSLGISDVDADDVQYLDINNNNKVDLADAKEILKVALGISEFSRR